ncbi:winged helix-turn-helix transcriptional regulator [Actinomycetospora endophytica]|uniref:winged helix-turn-helix transcriptional regulator n=1 Tax=Actinomycetospora endophytica TaxID=2291215 RepID=UPI0027E21824|nr:response regulator transcription factor [Actinomycetospora endophytica]
MELLLVTADPEPSSVLPSLALLPHRLKTVTPKVATALQAGAHDAVLVDARYDLAAARSRCYRLGSRDLGVPLVAILTEGGLVTVSLQWRVDEVLLEDAGAAEIDARLRLLRPSPAPHDNRADGPLERGDLVIDQARYTARLRGRPLELTYKEFELLTFLAQHPGRVFTRPQLLQQIWGYDFFGGARTVDVHVRRLRAKLGSEHEQLISTVRNVGYTFIQPKHGGLDLTPQTDDDP